jgi:hypothetical protein
MRLSFALAASVGVASAAYSPAHFHKLMTDESSKHFGTLSAHFEQSREAYNTIRNFKPLQAMSAGCQSAMESFGKFSEDNQNDPVAAEMGGMFEGEQDAAAMEASLSKLCPSSFLAGMKAESAKVAAACASDADKAAMGDGGMMLMIADLMDMMCMKENGKYCMPIMSGMDMDNDPNAHVTLCENSGCAIKFAQFAAEQSAKSDSADAADMPTEATMKAMIGVMCLKSNGEYCLPKLQEAETDRTVPCKSSCHRDFVNTLFAAVEADPSLCKAGVTGIGRRLLQDMPTGMPVAGSCADATEEMKCLSMSECTWMMDGTTGSCQEASVVIVDGGVPGEEEMGEEGGMFDMACDPDSAAITKAMLEVMCFKNAAGKFCIEIFNPEEDTSGTPPEDKCLTADQTMCDLTECSAECKSQMETDAQDSGCCYQLMVEKMKPLTDKNPLTTANANELKSEIMTAHQASCGIKLATDTCKVTVPPASECTLTEAWVGGPSAGAGGDAGMSSIMNGGGELASAASTNSFVAAFALAVAGVFLTM